MPGIGDDDDHGDDDDPRGAVPVPLAQVMGRRVREELPRFTFEGLKGAWVRVRANGFEYRGVLIGADEGELYLRGELRYLVLPLADVTDVRPEPVPKPAPAGRDGDEE